MFWGSFIKSDNKCESKSERASENERKREEHEWKKREKTEFSKKEKVAIQLDYGVRSIWGGTYCFEAVGWARHWVETERVPNAKLPLFSGGITLLELIVTILQPVNLIHSLRVFPELFTHLQAASVLYHSSPSGLWNPVVWDPCSY